MSEPVKVCTAGQAHKVRIVSLNMVVIIVMTDCYEEYSAQLGRPIR